MNLRFRAYFTALMGAAGIVLMLASWSIPGDAVGHWNALAAFGVVCFLSEAYYFRLRVGRTETQTSVAFIPYIATFLLFDGGWAAAITGSSMFFVDLLVRRKPLIKCFFNAAQVAVAIGAASSVFEALGGRASRSLLEIQLPPIAIAVAVTTYFLLNSTAVSIGVSLAFGEPFVQVWKRIAGSSLIYDLFSAPLGVLLAYLFARFQLPGILILVLPIYFVRHIYRVNLQLEQVNRDLLELMVKAIEARDPYTSGHSQRVSRLAEMLARAIGLNDKHAEQIRTAALLHDVGKIHEEYAPLLRKEGRLDPTEQALMQTHSLRSAELVGTISSFQGTITQAVRHHHENFDGSGYPNGLAGLAIPVGARIIMIADTVDAMTTDRPYRKALSYERVIQELHRYSGKQFDPSLVEALVASDAIREVVMRREQQAPEGVPAQPLPSSLWRHPQRTRTRSATA